MSNILIFLCIIVWGCSTFLNRLSVERMSPVIMQMVTGVVFIFCIPLFIKMSGGFHNIKWSATSIALTTCATLLSIAANILLYTSLKGSQTTGASTMLISLYPVVTLLLSAIFLSEQFTTLKILGVIAMIGGAVMLSWK
jgi:drug/metabolite transporter (DMT)-like permease